MISVAEATEKILRAAQDFGSETVALERAEGRVLAETWLADRDFPPFDRVTMDGVALRFEDFEAGFRRFKIVGTQAAGAPPLDFSRAEKGACAEAMTGAALPVGFDSVVRFEDLNVAEGWIFVKKEVKKGQNVHRKGSDRLAGELLAAPPRLISGAEIAVAATIGRAEIRVKRRPRALVVSTGDELVEVRAAPLEHQIRRSNALAVAAVLRQNGCETVVAHLGDDERATRLFFENALENVDFVVLSGGVSAGRFDFVPSVLAAMGAEKILHGVQQRPGKPMWVGRLGERLFFGLPGNPVSTFMCLHRFVLPWLRAGFGLEPFLKMRAALAEDLHFLPPLDYFLQVKTAFSADGRLIAHAVAGGGSGDLANLLEADGFLELPAAERDFFAAGEAFDVFFYR